VTSRDAHTEIVSLRIQSGPLDTTVTDPLALFRLRRVLRFGSGDEVKVTMTTGRNDDVALLYLRGMRFRLRNNGDNTYSGVFRAGWIAPPDDGFFDQSATFIGGIGDEDWTAEWTSFLVETDVQ